jgi:hypothetical protein
MEAKHELETIEICSEWARLVLKMTSKLDRRQSMEEQHC